MFDGNHTTNQNGDWGMVYGVVLTTVITLKEDGQLGTSMLSSLRHMLNLGRLPSTLNRGQQQRRNTAHRRGVRGARGHRDAASEVGCDEERS